MAKSKRKRVPKTVLKLPDLDCGLELGAASMVAITLNTGDGDARP